MNREDMLQLVDEKCKELDNALKVKVEE